MDTQCTVRERGLRRAGGGTGADHPEELHRRSRRRCTTLAVIQDAQTVSLAA
ncbi:hypothetical protein [Roseiflexus sp.]|uniref:hypothetical protein n=1 Tax=Roseiflexus sp. TaxID=2562120 RepID=UPI00398BA002